MQTSVEHIRRQGIALLDAWRADWNKFVRDALGVKLDREQQEILASVQFNPRTSVASGTARGKDFVAACAAVSFLYLTPRWNAKRELVKNTKVALTAPTDRQVKNIMMPEVARLFNRAKRRGILLPGRLNAYDIRTDNEEWFLTGFKADEHNHEAWSGFHAVNTMFIITEASGIASSTFSAIEGNLQGNSRLLLVFNPNVTTGYAANSMKSSRFNTFRLNSLNAENVIRRENVIPGQVDYEWVKDKVENWCLPIQESDFNEGEGDFKWEGSLFRPNDLFRVKVLGMFPRVSQDVLIPYEWIELANKRWQELRDKGFTPREHRLVGADVAGMGRDSSVLCTRRGDYVVGFIAHQSAGNADHMHVAGMIINAMPNKKDKVFIDTIGEGAGVYSRLQELGYDNAYSCKYSESAKNLHDITGEYSFANMRAYLYWCVRDWLNPKNGFSPALPPNERFTEEATQTKWLFQSNGSILIEKKDKVKERIKRSPDYLDALANTFYPFADDVVSDDELLKDFL